MGRKRRCRFRIVRFIGFQREPKYVKKPVYEDDEERLPAVSPPMEYLDPEEEA